MDSLADAHDALPEGSHYTREIRNIMEEIERVYNVMETEMENRQSE